MPGSFAAQVSSRRQAPHQEVDDDDGAVGLEVRGAADDVRDLCYRQPRELVDLSILCAAPMFGQLATAKSLELCAQLAKVFYLAVSTARPSTPLHEHREDNC